MQGVVGHTVCGSMHVVLLLSIGWLGKWLLVRRWWVS